MVIKVDRMVLREVGQVVCLMVGVKADIALTMQLQQGRRERHQTIYKYNFFKPTTCRGFI